MTTKAADVRPLSLGASRNLQKLIENDFSTLRVQLNQFVADLLTDAETKVKERWAAKGLDINAFIDRATELDRKYEDAKQALVREAQDVGIQLTKERYARTWTADASGLKSAIDKAQKPIRVNQDKANSQLAVRQKAAERRVLLATVTGEAEDLLQSLPTAAEFMAEAAKAKSLTT